MIRPITVLTALLLLSACAGETTNPYVSGPGGRGGTGGTNNGAGGRGGTHARGSQEDFVQYASDRIFFDTDQSLIAEEARAALERHVQWLRSNPRLRIWVAGNCDERGAEEYNLALGQRRASADRDYLASRGVEPARIQTISYGKTRPVDPASTPEGWARNRNAITSVQGTPTS